MYVDMTSHTCNVHVHAEVYNIHVSSNRQVDRVSVELSCPCLHRYESLVAGTSNYVAEYKNKLYCFASEANLDRFMR